MTEDARPRAEILLVEDSPTQAQLLAGLLEEQGYAVRKADCGPEALRLLEDYTPDLIFTDTVMPDMDGFDFTAAVKSDADLKHIPVVLLTSLSDPTHIIRAVNCKLDYFISKPFDPEFLTAKVASILENSRYHLDGSPAHRMEVFIGNTSHTIDLSPHNTANLLVSAYEIAVRINSKLSATQLDLRALNHDLENKVRERTAHLEEEVARRKEVEDNLLQRTTDLERVNAELREFAYVVSHDLKAPLRGVTQLAEWLLVDQADTLTEDGREMVDLMLVRLGRMHNLIEGILQYSKIGRSEERAELVDLNILIREIVDLLAPPESIEITIQNNMPRIRFDRTRIGQIFQNLIGNAIKYMDKPDGEITVACEPEGDMWRFSVTDNGPGIEEKYHQKIFRIFQTLSPRDEFESTGIGLTLVKKIVDRCGGSIHVASEPGKGSTFWFTFPMKYGVD